MNPTLACKQADVVVDGKRLETLWLEPRDASAATIVMLHEGLGSIALWKDFPHKLAARTGCGVLVYSRYGHGNSDKLAEKRPVEFMHHEGEVVLPELLDKLDISRPILLGHSDGGSIALIFAGKNPGRTRALILEAPHAFVEDLSIASIAAAKISFEPPISAPSWAAITHTSTKRSGDGTISGLIQIFARGISSLTWVRSAAQFSASRAKETNTEHPRRWKRFAPECQERKSSCCRIPSTHRTVISRRQRWRRWQNSWIESKANHGFTRMIRIRFRVLRADG